MYKSSREFLLGFFSFVPSKDRLLSVVIKCLFGGHYEIEQLFYRVSVYRLKYKFSSAIGHGNFLKLAFICREVKLEETTTIPFGRSTTLD